MANKIKSVAQLHSEALLAQHALENAPGFHLWAQVRRLEQATEEEINSRLVIIEVEFPDFSTFSNFETASDTTRVCPDRFDEAGVPRLPVPRVDAPHGMGAVDLTLCQALVAGYSATEQFKATAPALNKLQAALLKARAAYEAAEAELVELNCKENEQRKQIEEAVAKEAEEKRKAADEEPERKGLLDKLKRLRSVG